MYERFYGLRERAFNLTPDPAFLFLNQRNKEGLEHVLYGIERREGFATIVGDVGTGKTTLCWALLEKLESQKVRTALIQNPTLSDTDILKTILQDFGVGPKEVPPEALSNDNTSLALFNTRWMRGMDKKELIDQLNVFLADLARQDIFAVLIIDESQNLSMEMLEQLRLLSNLETAKKKLLQIIFAGQLELDEKLKSPALRQLSQRISVRFETKTLSLPDTERYVRHRLAMAGGAPKLRFGRGVFRTIWRSSRGYPRLINLICDRALLAGYCDRSFVITRKLVRKAVLGLKGKEDIAVSRVPRWLRGLIPFAALLALLSLALFLPFRKEGPKAIALSSPSVAATPAAAAAPAAPEEEKAPTPPPAPPARDARTPASSSGSNPTGFVLQIHSFQSDSLAQRSLPALEHQGYTPYVRYAGSGWYAVFAGPYDNLESARAAAQSLRDQGIQPIIRRP